MTTRLNRVRAAIENERQIVRRYRSELGLGTVIRQRVRLLLGMEGVDAGVGEATWDHAESLAVHERRLDALEEELRNVREIAAQARTLAMFDATERSMAARFDADGVLVTVVLPTLDRPAYLRRAVSSVLAQLHEHWELLVVDTGALPATAEVLASFDDPRIQVIDAHGSNSSVARNRALAAATGDVVTYLDDDNVLLPWWLRAAALTAQAHPDRLVYYGARVIEQAPGSSAWWQFDPFDPAEHAQRNLTDTGMIAHRRSEVVRWSEDHDVAPDWELIARLAAAGHEPLPVPVRAVLYSTSSPGRTTDRAGLL